MTSAPFNGNHTRAGSSDTRATGWNSVLQCDQEGGQGKVGDDFIHGVQWLMRLFSHSHKLLLTWASSSSSPASANRRTAAASPSKSPLANPCTTPLPSEYSSLFVCTHEISWGERAGEQRCRQSLRNSAPGRRCQRTAAGASPGQPPECPAIAPGSGPHLATREASEANCALAQH